MKTVAQIKRENKRNKKRAVKLLENLVSFINEGNSSSRDVWDILTALRGPDNGSGILKNATTARLRYALGLQEGKGNGFLTVKRPMLTPSQIQSAHKEVLTWHFNHHYIEAYRALAALGLLVEEKKKYAIFYPISGGEWIPSADVLGEFSTVPKAQAALDKYLKTKNESASHVGRKVRIVKG